MQTVLNAVMAANPIGLIIIAVVGLIGVITLLVKKWDVVKAALIKGIKAVGEFFKKLWEGVKNSAVAAFNKLKQALTKVLDGIKARYGPKITGFFSLCGNIVAVAKSVLECAR